MMKNRSKIIVCGIFVAVIFLSCSWGSGDYGWGNINVTGAAQLPYWASGFIFPPDIDGVDVFPSYVRGVSAITRITTYDSFRNLIYKTTQYCEWVDNNEKEELLERFNQDFFAARNLIIITFTAGANTIGLRVNNINRDGVISITEIERFRLGAVPSIGFGIPLAIETDKSFNPPNMSVSVNRVFR